MPVWKFTGGLPETKCGAGSTLAHTERLRDEIPSLLRDLRVRLLLDAPCGDLNWMSQADLSGVSYIGADCNPDHLAAARQRLSRFASAEVIQADVIHDALPHADAIICRDFLQHLPDGMVLRTLANFARSRPSWLIATSFVVSENIDISEPGMFRPLNLMCYPTALPAPTMCMDDGDGRVLGVWRGSELNKWI